MKEYQLHISDEPHCQDLESLGSIWGAIMKGVISKDDIIGADIVIHWRDIVGTEMSMYCNPLKTKVNRHTGERTLHVEVPAGGYALEIQHKSSYILDKVNAYVGYRAIHALKVNQNINLRPRQPLEPEIIPQPQVSEQDEKYLFELTEEIKDEKLKKILINIGKNVISTNRE